MTKSGRTAAQPQAPSVLGQPTDDLSQPVTPAANSFSQLDPNSRWNSFRRLCLYYAECIRLDERPFISASADKRGKTWAQVEGHINWQKLSSQQRTSVIVTDELREVIRANNQARRAPQLLIGVATDVIIKDDYKLNRPINR